MNNKHNFDIFFAFRVFLIQYLTLSIVYRMQLQMAFKQKPNIFNINTFLPFKQLPKLLLSFKGHQREFELKVIIISVISLSISLKIGKLLSYY
jgi:hypothetical protein